MKSYIVEFQVEKQGSTKQRTTVQAANRMDARAKVLSRHCSIKLESLQLWNVDCFYKQDDKIP